MACTIELKPDDLRAAIEMIAKHHYRKARNDSPNEQIAKIYNEIGDVFSNSLQTIIQTSPPIKK